MHWEDRQVRRQHEQLGRLAYCLRAVQAISGYVEIDGERTVLNEFERGRLATTMFKACQQKSDGSPSWSSGSMAAKVLDSRWDKAGHFKVIAFEPGDWERMLNTRAA